MFRRSLLLSAVAAVAIVPAFAGHVEVVGVGASQCKDYLAAAKADTRKDVYVQWVSGMITGIAALTTTVGPQGLTVDSLAADLKRFCTDHPSKTIFAAAGTLAEPYRVGKFYPLNGG